MRLQFDMNDVVAISNWAREFAHAETGGATTPEARYMIGMYQLNQALRWYTQAHHTSVIGSVAPHESLVAATVHFMMAIEMLSAGLSVMMLPFQFLRAYPRCPFYLQDIFLHTTQLAHDLAYIRWSGRQVISERAMSENFARLVSVLVGVIPSGDRAEAFSNAIDLIVNRQWKAKITKEKK